jgi:hypothetical protein
LNIWKLTIFGNPILIGDCAQTLKQLPDESVDLIVTDPPYGIAFMGKSWDKVLPSLESLKECCRVLKAGAFGFFMCSSRQDVLSRMICRLQDAGFETNFTDLFWLYATGFAKIANTSKMIDRRAGVEREVVGISSITGDKTEDIERFGYKETGGKSSMLNNPLSRLSQNSNHFYNWIMGNVDFKYGSRNFMKFRCKFAL